MPTQTPSKRAYLRSVAQKIQKAVPFLTHGPLGPKLGIIRDPIGIQQTIDTITKSAKNFYESLGGFDPVAQHVANFSGAGYADVSDVQTVGAIDVTIMTLANSLVPFLCIDRGLDKPADVIYYTQLVAVNSAGGLNAGDIASPNFAPPNNNITLGPSTKVMGPTAGTSTPAPVSVNFNTVLVPGTVVATINVGGTLSGGVVTGGTNYVGQDFSKNGVVYFSGTSITATVNYTTGAVTTSNMSDTQFLTVVAQQDSAGDPNGTNTLRVKPDFVPVMLVSNPKTITLEQNAFNTMYMNRIAANASQIQGFGDYTNIHFQKVAGIYTEDVNRDIIRLVVQMSASDSAITTLDLTNYTVQGSFNATKDDLVNRFIIDLRTAFLQKTGQAATVIITGSKGAAELESNALKWVKAPGFYGQLNGLAGTYDSIPVFRHNYLDMLEAGTNKANFYAACRKPDNSSGSIAFGEFLPLSQTPTAQNFNNPLQNATGFFSQIGQQVIQNTLVKKGYIQYPS